ncbi:transcriptional regulator [Deltaproteobacteria bacterium Smac51]|nr:transcriptional regulator [Deltaproteobacteria bacterium Smac51]
MSAHTNKHQIVTDHGGVPVAVVLPYSDYLRLLHPELNDPSFPHDVVEKNIIEGKTLIQSWREHLDLTQEEAAKRMGVKQSSYQQLEKKTARPRKTTIEKVAKAFGIDVRLLEE